ncbi:sialin-like [Mercenaria mercenaria]|uniref:sialin-like n=1 Tax=Mercenaria mercenaria TaxID=6596 RepID=UPI00234ED844|nr:sialin-like [Mercenaria mercenaria]
MSVFEQQKIDMDTDIHYENVDGKYTCFEGTQVLDTVMIITSILQERTEDVGFCHLTSASNYTKDSIENVLSNYLKIIFDDREVSNTEHSGVKLAVYLQSFWCSSRFVLIVIGFCGLVNLYALRVTMSVAIVCMTGSETSNTSSFADGNVSESYMPEIVTYEFYLQYESRYRYQTHEWFDWDKETQGLILGSFYLGYALTLLPSGWLSGRYGGKHLFGWSMFVCAVATLFTPLAARTSVVVLIVIRVLTGLCQIKTSSKICPIYKDNMTKHLLTNTMAQQADEQEHKGNQIGLMVAFPVSGVLCVDGFDGGWPNIFYVFGSLGVVWFLAWMYLVYDSPGLHPRIFVKEREYIVEQLKSDIDISKQAGFLASLPYLGFWVISNVSAHLADFLRKRGYISTTTARKVFNSIGGKKRNILPAIVIAILGNVANDPGIAVAMLTLGMTMSGCQYGSGFKTKEQWKTVFYITAAIYTFGAIFYIIFASGELQDWARDEDDDQEINVSDKSATLEEKKMMTKK